MRVQLTEDLMAEGDGRVSGAGMSGFVVDTVVEKAIRVAGGMDIQAGELAVLFLLSSWWT